MRTRNRLSRASSSPRSCSHATFQKLPATRGFVRMRTRGRLSGASDSPGLFACEHATAFLELPAPRGLVRMRPFRSFQQPEVLFACEHAGAFLELPTPQVCSHANTQPPFSSFQLPEVLFACEHANTFLELPAPRSLVRMRTREHLSRASGNPRFCSHANTQPPFGGTKPSHLHPET